jgi:phosphomannomutase
MANLLFDVDGTLTLSRQKINEYLLMSLKELSFTNVLYIVTGSDYEKTIEQLGESFIHEYIAYCFNCSGNSIWEKGVEVYKSSWQVDPEIVSYLEVVLAANPWKDKTGAHFDHRPGMLNFSILGRNANKLQRFDYELFDEEHKDRVSMIAEFNDKFEKSHNVVAQIAGKTGFDIYYKGADKGQVLNYFNNVPVSFFGDDTAPGGNDYSLARAILDRGFEEDKVYAVDSWEHTKEILEDQYLYPAL